MTKTRVVWRVFRGPKQEPPVPPRIEVFQSYTGDDGREVNFGVDAENNLYLNGKKVLVEQRLRLSGLQTFWAVVTAVSVVGASMAAMIDVYMSHFSR